MLLVHPPEYPHSLPTKATTPNITVHPECELASQRAREYVVDLDELHTTLCTQLAEAQKHYQGPADC